MNQIKSIALAALLLAASACTGSESSQVDEGQADGTTIPTIAISELPSEDAPSFHSNPYAEQSPELSFTADLNAQLVEDFGDVCECATDDSECQSQWVEATFGCGMCAFATCEGGQRLGSCVACD